MLRSYLTALPHTKFVLIEDSIEHQGKQIFDFLIKGHLNRIQTKVHYFVFHGSFHRAKIRYSGNIHVHDFTSDVCGWDKTDNREDFERVASRLGAGDVVIVDSLAHAIFQYGLAETYRVFNILKTQTGVQQIITLLHKDLIDGSKDKLVKCFEHLCTLSISIEPKFVSGNGRVQYTYKKLGGKIIKQIKTPNGQKVLGSQGSVVQTFKDQYFCHTLTYVLESGLSKNSEIEEYKFEGENFVTQKIDRPDPKALLQNALPTVNPKTLTTFRIGLNDQEMESRDGLALPYLYEEDEEVVDNSPGEIHYAYDEVDDFDEEDPDDDLNF